MFRRIRITSHGEPVRLCGILKSGRFRTSGQITKDLLRSDTKCPFGKDSFGDVCRFRATVNHVHLFAKHQLLTLNNV